MRVHLVHAHPEPRSFVAAMRDTVREAFEARGDTVTVSDLYAMGFNPVLSAADFEERERPGHLAYTLEQRHAFAAGTLAPDIRAEVEHVLAADLLALAFPVFWFGPPVQPPIPVAHPHRCQVFQPQPQRHLRITPGPVTVGRAPKPHRRTGPALADLVGALQHAHHITTHAGPHHFF